MKCSIGVFLKSKCTTEKKLRTYGQFSSRQWTLLKLRSCVADLENVCVGHAERYGRLFSVSQKVCCNPLNLHVTARRKQLKTISAAFHDKFNQFFPRVIEGQKLCIVCFKTIKKETESSSPVGISISATGND